MDDFSLFTEAPAAMSCQHGPMRWRASLAAAEFSSHVILYHEFVHPEMKYLNFMIKLTIGIKSEGKHVQYCVNKIEVQ